MSWLNRLGNESEGVSLRKKVPSTGVHVSEALVDELHSLSSVVEDTSLVLPVEAVSDYVQGSVVLVELVHANLLFRFYGFVFGEKY